jgi:hypothetical protein
VTKKRPLRRDASASACGSKEAASPRFTGGWLGPSEHGPRGATGNNSLALSGERQRRTDREAAVRWHEDKSDPLRRDASAPRCRGQADTTAEAVAYKRARPLKRPEETVMWCM